MTGPQSNRPVKDGMAITITPSAEQYRQLVEDLDRLRRAGATSNTAAIVDAVRRMARGYNDPSTQNGASAAKTAPPPAPGG